MTPAAVTARAMHYLRYNRQCQLMWTQRSPWDRWDHRPDVIALTKSRRVIEVEVKVTLADFKVNAEKRCMTNPVLRWHEGPVWNMTESFYFAVPVQLIEKIKPLLPDYAGLLAVEENPWNTRVSVQAPKRRDSPRLSTKQMVIAARHLSGTLVSMQMKISRGELDDESEEVTCEATSPC